MLGAASLTRPSAGAITVGLSSAERIKQGYERFPYPGSDVAALSQRGGSMPALRWMLGIGRPGSAKPRRVLIAGCGTGVEAFRLRLALPQAEIVAVDFSPRSIAVAQKWERSGKFGRPIRFLVGDLTAGNLRKEIGGDFDLITCHGVLSYIPEPARALRALVTCLAAGGALCGVVPRLLERRLSRTTLPQRPDASPRPSSTRTYQGACRDRQTLARVARRPTGARSLDVVPASDSCCVFFCARAPGRVSQARICADVFVWHRARSSDVISG